MKSTHEIQTVEEFRQVTTLRVADVVITDTPTSKTTAHRPTCRRLTEESFATKVVENGNRNGRYSYYLRFEDAATEDRRASVQGLLVAQPGPAR